MHPPFSIVNRLLWAGIALVVSSCSTPKKRDADSDGGLLGRILIDGVGDSGEETYTELKRIADAPTSHLPRAQDEAGDEMGDATESAEVDETVDPIAAWKREGVEPRRISIGDIFSENVGPILNKQFSPADELPVEERRNFFEQISKEKDTQVPMTLSQSEIAALREEANPAKPFPTRSVALDFKTTTRSADVSKLQNVFRNAEKGDSPDGLDPDKAKEKIVDLKKRLGEGERLFTVVGVTRSDRMKATYPGAPVGSRDAEPILNAVEILYPHLDSLEATKDGEAVEITRDEGIYWEFEARELKLENNEIIIDEETVANQ